MDIKEIKYLYKSEISLELQYKIAIIDGDTEEDTYPNIKRYIAVRDTDTGKCQYIKFKINNSYVTDIKELKIKEPSLLYEGCLEYKIILNGEPVKSEDKIINIGDLEPDHIVVIEILLVNK